MHTTTEDHSNPLIVQRTVENVIHHTREIFEIHLSRQDESFYPGQYLSIMSDHPAIHRAYSVASGIHEPWFRFIIRHIPEGRITHFLHRLQKKDTVYTSLPAGNFRPGLSHPHGDFIFIATGTGIAPLLSYLKSYPEKPPRQILYGIRYLQEAIVLPELLKYCPTQLAISRENIAGHHHGRVTDLLHLLPITSHIHYYLCGLEGMIKDVTDWLKSQGVSEIQIHRDTFTNE